MSLGAVRRWWRRPTTNRQSFKTVGTAMGAFWAGRNARRRIDRARRNWRRAAVDAMVDEAAGGIYGRYAGRSVEKKFFDGTLSSDPVPNTGGVEDSLLHIAQGVTESTRVGRKITVTKLQCRYSLTLPEADGTADPSPPDVCRVIIFIDKQTNGAAAAVTDILETGALKSFNNLANKGRFQILLNRVHYLNYMSGGVGETDVWSSAGIYKQYSANFNLNLPIEYNSTTGAIGEITSNNIGCLLISGNNVIAFDMKYRVRFLDG